MKKKGQLRDFKYEKMLFFLKIPFVILLLIIATLFIYKGVTKDIDGFGTHEIDLVKTNGTNVCQSCIGLADANLLENLKKLFNGEKK